MEDSKQILNFLKKMRALVKLTKSAPFSQRPYYQNRLNVMNSIFNRLCAETLSHKLFEVYDELCPDDEMAKNLSEYICLEKGDHQGVKVQAYDFPGTDAVICIRFSPLRIEIKSLVSDYKEVYPVAA